MKTGISDTNYCLRKPEIPSSPDVKVFTHLYFAGATRKRPFSLLVAPATGLEPVT